MPTLSLLEQTLSERALLEAWQHVQRNAGCAGHDGQSIARFSRNALERLRRLKGEVLAGQYRPLPLQAIEMPKASGGIRTLAVPAVRDRVLQTAVSQMLGQCLEPQFDDASFAYRPGRSVAMAIQRIGQQRDAGLVQVVDADILGFFDHIDHDLLLQSLARAVPELGAMADLVALWLAADLRSAQRAAPARLIERGLPQGSPLSPLLSNLYLSPFDAAMRGAGHALVRYADDFVLQCAHATAARSALGDARAALHDLRLALHPEKTRLADFDRGFTFLGVRFVHRLAETVTPAAARWLTQVAGGSATPSRGAAMPPGQPRPATRTGRLLCSIDPAVAAEQAQDGASALVREPLLQTLYVGEPGALLTKEHDRVVVSCQRQVLKSIPLGQLDQIALMDNALVSTAMLRACAERRIAVAFSGPGGELACLERGSLPDQQIVVAQWRAQECAELSLLFARQFIDGKLHNSRTVLRRFARREMSDAIHAVLLGLDDCQRRLASATSLNSLRGLEGGGARHHFEGLRALLPHGVEFGARRRQPPTDPVNAMLSMGYMVLHHNMHTLLRLQGLNPHLGHLHRTAPGTLALASDLIEEFRAPVVDAVVLTLLRQRQVQPADFELGAIGDELPCRMRSEPRRRFIAALEAKLDSPFVHPRLGITLDYRRAMQAQVRHYLEVLARAEAVYQPLKLR